MILRNLAMPLVLFASIGGSAHAMPLAAGVTTDTAIVLVDFHHHHHHARFHETAALKKSGWYPGKGMDFCRSHPGSHRCGRH